MPQSPTYKEPPGVSSARYASCFAQLANNWNYCRPELTDESSLIELEQARHPVIEQLSETPFIANDVALNDTRTS